MKRVKTDNTSSPDTGMKSASSKTDLTSSSSDPNLNGILNPSEERAKADSTSKFKSPLLQKLVDNKQTENGDTPKFKSPLLQNLMGKKRLILDGKEEENGRTSLGDRKELSQSRESVEQDSSESAISGDATPDSDKMLDINGLSHLDDQQEIPQELVDSR